ncbi:type II toxin-antitoxin system VapC family toxin [Rhizobium tubonense]|uniref:Ribonuclease VapC n=1 Tax=Rhizobium tubonense TaxID=484088 RepID=A0A2W4CJF8_9HYPH|nr:type II toxin-antitoxin system VapC family toxin [Rhizobium tubonense]PZM13049.1 VapC toxin family PIN domain ribonuclease [Rhizobium tubonense]
MIILDTNVVSEPMKSGADSAVVAWLDRQPVETLYLTAISLAELLVGIEVLPDGRRKDGLGDALNELISGLFGMRVLPFDEKAAATYASLVSRARGSGHTISMADGQVAAIAATCGFTVATRDISPFLAAGVPVVNPWRE